MTASDQIANTAVRVSKIGYVALDTPDLDRMSDYFTRVLEFTEVDRDADEVFLTPSVDHHSIVLRKSAEARGRTTVGFAIHEDLTIAKKRLEDAGIAVSRRSDIAPSTPDVLVLEEPGTGAAIHLYDHQAPSQIDASNVIRPTKLGHVAAYVPDLPTLQNFYQGLLGFRWSDTIGDFFVFLRCNSDHHAANFMASQNKRDMHHIAFETRDLNHLQTLVDHLASENYRLEWGPGRHGAGHNIFTYHRDPDGNLIELFSQLDVMLDESQGYFEPRPWHSDFPAYPKTWEVDALAMNSWGPLNAFDH